MRVDNSKVNTTPGAADLQAIYPAAKTQKQEALSVARRQQNRIKRRKKYSKFKISLAASILFYFALVLGKNIESMWLGGGFGGIFIFFAVMLALIGGFYLWSLYVRSAFYTYGRSLASFTMTCSLVAFVLFGVALSDWWQNIGGDFQLLLCAGLHFLAMLLILQFTLVYTEGY